MLFDICHVTDLTIQYNLTAVVTADKMPLYLLPLYPLDSMHSSNIQECVCGMVDSRHI